jgi:hypothetical protein
MKIGMYTQILVKIPNAKFYENPFSGSGIVTCDQSDKHFLRLFVADAPEMLLI